MKKRITKILVAVLIALAAFFMLAKSEIFNSINSRFGNVGKTKTVSSVVSDDENVEDMELANEGDIDDEAEEVDLSGQSADSGEGNTVIAEEKLPSKKTDAQFISGSQKSVQNLRIKNCSEYLDISIHLSSMIELSRTGEDFESNLIQILNSDAISSSVRKKAENINFTKTTGVNALLKLIIEEKHSIISFIRESNGGSMKKLNRLFGIVDSVSKTSEEELFELFLEAFVDEKYSLALNRIKVISSSNKKVISDIYKSLSNINQLQVFFDELTKEIKTNSIKCLEHE